MATSIALQTSKKIESPTNEKEFNAAIRKVGLVVSEALGNTPTVALKSYIDPIVFIDWQSNLAQNEINVMLPTDK